MKGKLKSGAKNSWLRNGLVIFQFAVSVILVIGTMVIYQQLQYLNSKQLDALLKPLGEKLNEFRGTVESSHRAGTVQHEVMKQKLGELEELVWQLV